MEVQRQNTIPEDISFRLSVLKLAAIIAVVYVHSYAAEIHLQTGDVDMNQFGFVMLVENFLSQHFARVAVPLFFSISGFLYFSKEQTDFSSCMRKKIKFILWPYLLWNSICIAYMFVFQSVPFAGKYFTKDLIVSWGPREWLNAYIGFGNEWYPFLVPLWFLFVLFAVFVIIHPIRKYLIRRPSLVWILCVVNIGYSFFCFSWEQFFSFSRYINALSFFCFGYLIALHLKKVDTKTTCILSGTVFLILCIVRTVFPSLLKNVLPSVFDGYAGAVFMFSLSQFLPLISAAGKKKLLFLSSFSFLVYLTHENLLTIVKKFIYSQMPQVNPYNILSVYIFLTAVVILFLLAFGCLMKKKFPAVYRFLFFR